MSPNSARAALRQPKPTAASTHLLSTAITQRSGRCWSGARLVITFAQVAEAGAITGLDGLTQGLGLDVRPFLAGRWLRQGGDNVTTGQPGLDVFYNVTPSLRLTATVNTDFGETEVDARQINLTRFSLLFPEKRAFFQQGAGVFGFAKSISSVIIPLSRTD